MFSLEYYEESFSTRWVRSKFLLGQNDQHSEIWGDLDNHQEHPKHLECFIYYMYLSNLTFMGIFPKLLKSGCTDSGENIKFTPKQIIMGGKDRIQICTGAILLIW